MSRDRNNFENPLPLSAAAEVTRWAVHCDAARRRFRKDPDEPFGTTFAMYDTVTADEARERFADAHEFTTEPRIQEVAFG